MSSETPSALPWCYDVLAKGVNHLVNEFRAQLKRRVSEGSTFENFNNPRNKNKIRYCDIMVNDNNIVSLSTDNGENDFIHANYITTPFSKKRFIATQGPLEETKRDFWRMVIENQVEVIVMLCNTVEKDVNKCSLYFPCQVGYQNTFDNIIVTCMEVGPISEECIEVTRTILEIEYDYKNLIVCHYRWTDWPDTSVPQNIEPIIKILDSIRHLKTPIVAHCSAGIGRTGCLIAVEHYIERVILNQKLEDGVSCINNLRTMRQHSIQTEKQYVFIHYCIIKIVLGGFRDLLPTDIGDLYEAFQKDYEECL
uniref:Protein-tyrosine phosphatase n=1 Tax=Strongyloides papillosus TaxID=174720 RepID=A0A0N5BKI3_STREA